MKDNFKWNKQSEFDIWYAINDWGYHKFACIMSDGSLQQFVGLWDENMDGERSLYLDHIDDAYGIDDIVMWIEIPSEDESNKNNR